MSGKPRGQPDLPPGPARDLVDLLRELAKAAPLSDGQIAFRTGLSRSFINEVRRGWKRPSPATAEKVARALGATSETTRRARQLAEALAELTRYQRSHAGDADAPPVPYGDARSSRGRYQPPAVPIYRGASAFDLAGSGCRVAILTGSIRRARCADLWVNPENTDMEMSRITDFSISAIIRYEAARLDEAGRVVSDIIADELAATVTTRPVAAGTAVVTGSGRLAETHHVAFIIHVAAVHGEPGGGYRQVRNVGSCVTNALAKAEDIARAGHKVRSILIPVLGVGMGGGPVGPTVQSLLDAAVDHLTQTPDTVLETVYFLAYTDAEYDAFMNVIGSSPWLSPSTRPG